MKKRIFIGFILVSFSALTFIINIKYLNKQGTDVSLQNITALSNAAAQERVPGVWQTCSYCEWETMMVCWYQEPYGCFGWYVPWGS